MIDLSTISAGQIANEAADLVGKVSACFYKRARNGYAVIAE